jgi:hypothetical protein
MFSTQEEEGRGKWDDWEKTEETREENLGHFGRRCRWGKRRTCRGKLTTANQLHGVGFRVDPYEAVLVGRPFDLLLTVYFVKHGE